MKRRALMAAVAAAILAVQADGRAQFGGGFGFGREEQKVVAIYDKNGTGRLERDERRAARTALGDPPRRSAAPAAAAAAAAGPRLTPADTRPPYPTTPLYDLQTLRTIYLDFEDADWEQELTTFYNTDVEVPATMTVDGKTYREVGIHFRGASSFRMVPAGYKHSLNVSLDFVHDQQELGGYRTLNLLNSNSDPTFLRTMLYSEVARQYVPTPRVNHMKVVINGENWGIFLNVQQFNGDFLRDNFKTRQGARWKVPGNPRGGGGLEYFGDNPASYKSMYEIKTKDSPESWNALIQLTKVLNQTPPDKLEAALAPILDIDGALRFLAVEMTLMNSDSYWSRASDYSIYRDVKGRFHVLPHDFNEAFGSGGGFGGGGGPALDPLSGINDPSKPLRSKLLAVPALRQRYLGYVKEIATTWLDWNKVSPILAASHKLIAAEVKMDNRKLYEQTGFDAAAPAAANNPIKSFADRRRVYLLDYMARAEAQRAAK
jgi:hypothetical protein